MSLCTAFVAETESSRSPRGDRAVKLRLVPLFVLSVACSDAPRESTADAQAAIDSLNARIVQAYRDHDEKTYATLYTDSAAFEWPNFDTVRGRAGLESMVRGNWASLDSMDLKLTVASRHIASDHATEFGAFEQSWRDPKGRMTEYGRYVTYLARQPDNTWFFGFEDSLRLRANQP
jgi:ketosteroid isomerase-like protein